MAWGASAKNAYYLVHIIPFYAFFLACAGCWLWRRSDRVRWVATSMLCIVLGLQLSWSLYRILWQRPYQKQYLPVVRFLREHVTPQDIVCSNAEMAFGLGFHNTQLVDDLWMGRWSGKLPSVVVVDHWYYYQLITLNKKVPVFHRYVNELLRTQFHEIYSQPDRYQIYRRNGTASQ